LFVFFDLFIDDGGDRTVDPDKPSEAHHPRLFLRQLQSEFPKSIRQVLVELVRIEPVLEVHHEIISPAFV
jgi:hypothetical protein